jgi:hypothetical protein
MIHFIIIAASELWEVASIITNRMLKNTMHIKYIKLLSIGRKELLPVGLLFMQSI